MAVIVGMGTTFKKGAGPAVVNLTSIDGVSVTSDSIESTHLGTVGGYRTFVNGLKDSGEVTLSGYFDPTHSSFLTDFEAGTSATYTITFPNASTWTFSGVVTSFGTGSVEMEDLIPVEIVIKVSGKPTLA